MLEPFKDKSAFAQCVIAYSSGPGMQPEVFVGVTHGNIVKPRGPTKFGWDPVFQPEDHELTYAELSVEIKNSISHRSRALAAFKDYLNHYTELSSNVNLYPKLTTYKLSDIIQKDKDLGKNDVPVEKMFLFKK